MKPETYVPEKWVWTDGDFERMDWHDGRIHAIAATNKHHEQWTLLAGQLLLDIDYILKWVEIKEPKKHYEFWTAPATLIFDNVSRLKMRVDTDLPEWDIWKIRREREVTTSGQEAWLWTIELDGGSIDFLAAGFRQHIRRGPTLRKEQHFRLDERGGISFETPSHPKT